MQLPLPELAAGMAELARVLQQLDEAALLLGKGAEDGGGRCAGNCGIRHASILHTTWSKGPEKKGRLAPPLENFAGPKTCWPGRLFVARSKLLRKEARLCLFLSRSSRRRIFPTGVLGRSVRNSTTLGCL